MERSGKTSSRIVSPRWIRRERLKTATPEIPKVRNSTSPSSCQSSLWLRASVKRARTRRPSNVLSAARSPTTVADTGQRMGRSEVRGRRNVSAIPVGLPPVAIITACACRASFLRGTSASAFRSERSSDFRSSCFFAFSARAGRFIWSAQPSGSLRAVAILAPQIKVIPRRSQTLRSASRTDSARRERGYSRPSSEVVMMPSEEKKPISSCSGWVLMTDSTNAGWLYR